jgi:Bacterial PH domain
MMGAKVFRGVPRIVALTLVFLFGAGFAAFAAALSKDSRGLAIGLWILAGVLLLLALRFPFTRAVATPEGLKLHGAVGNATFRWSEIASISSGKTEQEGSFINVRAPVLHLTSGKKVPVAPASTYSTDAAARTAAELDHLRQSYSR